MKTKILLLPALLLATVLLQAQPSKVLRRN
jgi:hypothetical protein